MYGTVLISFQRTKVRAALGDNAPVDRLDLIFKNNIANKDCGIGLLDSPMEILPLALHYLGLPPGNRPADYAKSEQLLNKIRRTCATSQLQVQATSPAARSAWYGLLRQLSRAASNAKAGANNAGRSGHAPARKARQSGSL